MVEKEFLNIRVCLETKSKLDKLKVHPRETYQDVIQRLTEIAKKDKTWNKK